MKQFSVHEAKTHLSRLLLLVSSGQEIIITNSGVPVAKLVSFSAKTGSRGKGIDTGKVKIAADFNAPLPKKWQKFFE